MTGFALLMMVSLAGGGGAVLRYVVDSSIPARVRDRFPWGTNLVNVTGSFALGALTGMSMTSAAWHTVLSAGLLGGYTTFSAASLETVLLAGQRRPLRALANGLGMLVLCIGAALAGLAVA